MNLYIIFGIILTHWLADFVAQSNEDAQKKSVSNIHLLSHTVGYSLIWYTVGVAYVIFHLDTYVQWHLTYFILITFVCHTITDYFTSRLNKRLWEKKDVHNFFVSIGFDQVLHYVQLFLTFKLLF